VVNFFPVTIKATILLIGAVALCDAGGPAAPRREIENVAAFTRLYGVVRYFYPGDAAAALDWDRFVVYGVKRVRAARNAKALATTLEELFVPLGPGIAIGSRFPRVVTGARDGRLIAWRAVGVAAGWPSVYRSQRTNRPIIDGYATQLTQTIPAKDLRGKALRLRGQVRARAGDSEGAASIRLSVSRGEKGTDYFDMSDRPIREASWQTYTLECNVPQDAINVSIAVIASGAVIADFDALKLEMREAAGAWAPVAVEDLGFEVPGQEGAWKRIGNSKYVVISRPEEHAPEGRRYLRFAPPAAGTPAAESLDAGAKATFGDSWAPETGAFADVDVGSGIRARISLALTDIEARRSHEQPTAALTAVYKAVRSTAGPSSTPDVDARLGDVVVAWNVFRHFYPYWSEVKVDWDARLAHQLQSAYRAQTRNDEQNSLRALVADARDGHGFLTDSLRPEDHRPDDSIQLPVRLALIDGRVIVTASEVPQEAPVGAVVSAIEGIAVEQRLETALSFVSGSEGWKQVRALGQISKCTKGISMNVTLDFGAGRHERDLACTATTAPSERRPKAISELSLGVWYVDLTRARMADLTPFLETLAHAKGIVFDVRGYPTDSGYEILRYLIGSPESDRWMHMAKIVGPFGQVAGSQDVGWDLKPAAPHFEGKIVFMTDSRAISYAESVMGYVADRKLGTIVGAQTAGTNGGVATVRLPGGFKLWFTGTRVTGHDGETPFHLTGVKPHVVVHPSLAGLRAGRDEVLERAMALANPAVQ
jgi:hypothetical protein